MTRKPKVFLDTNTFISGVVFAGNERKLLDAIIDGKLDLILSAFVIEEAGEVLRKKFPRHAALFPLFLKLVKHEVISRKGYKGLEGRYSRLLEDRGDVPILAAAVAGKVDYLVTGDKGLLELKKIGNTAIVRAGELLEKLKLDRNSPLPTGFRVGGGLIGKTRCGGGKDMPECSACGWGFPGAAAATIVAGHIVRSAPSETPVCEGEFPD